MTKERICRMNIYDRKEFDRKLYPWTDTVLKKSKRFTYFGRLNLFLFLINVSFVICLKEVLKIIDFLGYMILLIAAMSLYVGWNYALLERRWKVTVKLPSQESHDMMLLYYHGRRRKSRIVKLFLLANMAWTDIKLEKYSFALQALGQIETKKMTVPQKYEYESLKEIATVGETDAEKTKELMEIFSKKIPKRKYHPIRIFLLSLFVAYSIGFFGLSHGLNVSKGYELRQIFGTVSLCAVSIGWLIFGTWGLIWLYRKRGLVKEVQEKEKKTKGKVIRPIKYGLIFIILVIFVGINFLITGLQIDGKETTKSKDSKYTYLEVEWAYGQEMYRTNNPIIRQNMSNVLAESVRGLKDNEWNKQSGNTEDITIEDSETKQETDQNELGTDQNETEENSQKSQKISCEMNAVFDYLTEQTIIQNSGTLQYNANAKGETYGYAGEGQEEKGGTEVDIWYGIYDNGAKTDDSGEMKEEYVLIKKYADGGYEDEIMGFYLVDPTSLEVTDEHKTSW